LRDAMDKELCNRRKILDEGICQRCGSEWGIHVCYVIPVSNFIKPSYADMIENLITVCDHCVNRKSKLSIINCRFGKDVYIPKPYLVNLYGCTIGDETKIGAFVEIQYGVKVGNRCKISSHSFLCTGVTIEDEVMVAHGVKFCNDKFPRACNSNGTMKSHTDYKSEGIKVCKGASIGSNATILPGVTIGENAMVGAGSVVTKDILENTIAVGVPAETTEGCFRIK